MSFVPALVQPPSPWSEEMHMAVDALTSRLGLSVMRELSTHGSADATELMEQLHVNRMTLLRMLRKLEVAGVVVGNLPPGERRFQATRYHLDVDRVEAYLAQIHDLVLGEAIQPEQTQHQPDDTEA